jgi:hypothetical protein
MLCLRSPARILGRTTVVHPTSLWMFPQSRQWPTQPLFRMADSDGLEPMIISCQVGSVECASTLGAIPNS